MRSSRLISILLLLQTRGRMTADDLARELEVSVRTIYRDVDALAQSGVPIYADRGTHGGFSLVEGYRTRLTGLTTDEAETLFLSGYPGPAAELGLGTVLAAAQLKVLAALPPELRSRAARVRQRFHLDAPGWFQEPDAAPHLQPIADAIWTDRRLRLDYRRPDAPESVTRIVDPLGVVLKGGVWYLVGRVGGGLRTYRVSRISHTDVLEEHFERPDDFDLAEYWGGAVSAYVGTFATMEATFRLRGDAIDRLSSAIGGRAARAALEAAGEPDAEGWVTARVQVEDLWRGELIALQLGPESEVVAPRELRARVVRSVAGLAERYRERPRRADRAQPGDRATAVADAAGAPSAV